MPKKIQIALALGDGSGPEMMTQAIRVIERSAKLDDIEIEWVPTPMGWNAYEEFGDTLPESSLETATKIGLLYFGGVGDPKLDNTIGKEHPEMKPEARCLLRIRKDWGLLLNFRPMIFNPKLANISNLRPEMIPKEGMQQHFIRYLLEDTYFGNSDILKVINTMNKEKKEIAISIINQLGVVWEKKDVTGKENRVTDFATYTRKNLELYFRNGFQYAEKMGLPVICIDKSNVSPRYVFWRKVFEKIHREEFSHIKTEKYYVDAANAMLFKNPASLHAVIFCGNEHGDILSDAAAEALGSMGLMCSSAVNPTNRRAMFESGAGTAPTLAGKDIVNPIGRILTGAMMLRHIGATKGAAAIEKAVNLTLSEGFRTPDIASKETPEHLFIRTVQMTDAILDRMSV